MYQLPAFVFTVFFFLSESAVVPDSNEGLVVDGQPAVLGQFPWMCALHYRNNFRCTASIISPTTVLTAAHCIVTRGDKPPANLFHCTAHVNRSSPIYRIEFSRTIVHPGYPGRGIDNDVAIMKTSSPIPFDGKIPIQPICIPRPDTGEMEYPNATAMGWGTTDRIDMESVPETLQYTHQYILPTVVCQRYRLNADRNKICAMGFFTGICSGDSGGPLVSRSADKRPVTIGVTSYVSAMVYCATYAPAVFARTSKYTIWITRVANDNTICIV